MPIRERKPYTRIAKSKPRLIKPGHYKVDSDTDTLRAYNVRARYSGRDTLWECDCEQFVRGNDCKHVNRVLQELGVELWFAR